MLSELKQLLQESKDLLQSLHGKLDTLLAKEQPATTQFVQFADGEVEKIVSEVVARLTGESVPQPAPQSDSEAQQIEVQQQ